MCLHVFCGFLLAPGSRVRSGAGGVLVPALRQGSRSAFCRNETVPLARRRGLPRCVLSVLVTERISVLTALGVKVGFLKIAVKIFSEIWQEAGYQQPPTAVKVSRSVLAQTTLPSFLPPSVGVKMLFRKEAVGGRGQPTGKYWVFLFPLVGCRGTEHRLGSRVGSAHLLTLLLIGGYYSPLCCELRFGSDSCSGDKEFLPYLAITITNL